MNFQSQKSARFALTEFPESNLTTTVDVLFKLSNAGINFVYTITGDLSDVNFPLYKKERRENNLWENSCFEFFIAEKQTTEYREFNFSPSGKWNVYSFDSHRKNMKEEEKVKNVKIRTEREKNKFVLFAYVDFRLAKPASNYEFQLATILKTKDGIRHFFAIDNSSEQPDFHNRKFFVDL